MTNWKADPKVQSLRKFILDGMAPDFDEAMNDMRPDTLDALCAAVAASGSPPSPRTTLNMDEIEGAVEVDESAIALDLERDRIVFPLDVMSGSGSLIFEVRIPLSAVLRASSGSTGAPSDQHARLLIQQSLRECELIYGEGRAGWATMKRALDKLIDRVAGERT